MRHTSLAVLVAFAMSALAPLGCEGGPEPFRPCAVDPILRQPGTQRCTSSGEAGATETCVFLDHPQCPDAVCLVWESSAPFCSSPCSGDADCPPDSSCQTPPLGGAQRYCVPHVLPQPPAADDAQP